MRNTAEILATAARRGRYSLDLELEQAYTRARHVRRRAGELRRLYRQLQVALAIAWAIACGGVILAAVLLVVALHP